MEESHPMYDPIFSTKMLQCAIHYLFDEKISKQRCNDAISFYPVPRSPVFSSRLNPPMTRTVGNHRATIDFLKGSMIRSDSLFFPVRMELCTGEGMGPIATFGMSLVGFRSLPECVPVSKFWTSRQSETDQKIKGKGESWDHRSYLYLLVHGDLFFHPSLRPHRFGEELEQWRTVSNETKRCYRRKHETCGMEFNVSR